MTIFIGLTGTMLSGKSSALKIFKKCGAEVISADDIVHRLINLPETRALIIKEFGGYDRNYLAKQVFSDAKQRARLESILHPLVRKEGERVQKSSKKAIVVFEVPLLFEAGWEKDFDLTITISASPKAIMARLAARNVTAQDYKARMSAQMSDEDKLSRADIAIYNNGELKDLEVKIKKICKLLK